MSGAMVGTVMVPVKFMRKYHFENYWLVYNLTGTVLIPWALAFGTVPNLIALYRQLPAGALVVRPHLRLAGASRPHWADCAFLG